MIEEMKVNEQLIIDIQGIIEELLDKMGIVAAAEYKEDAIVQEVERIPRPLLFDIDCANPGILIGRAGQTLDSLQYLLRTMISHMLDEEIPPIVVDVSGYKQRRYKYLKDLAVRAASQVVESGEPLTLEPMSAYERRIIHTALNDDERVITESTGFEDSRKVVIKPAK
ncbi:MAG: KH domain-containing protein [Dehalococcoidales bacterium]|nr:KH domain-containing protein [Dehalococcoidales bacterium]MDD4230132.1 KH domain-containing protein [Dehalococcoidales bacterium]MDD4465287.1 KH domain-containing protein [Dehalococcoidales bacterium]MDD5402324.1 KH domain-containing protein [Dehalococcoidales bacterium]